MQMDILQHDELPFPRSLPEFQRLFPDNESCVAYLLKLCWPDGFICPYCAAVVNPLRFASQTTGMSAVQFQRQLGLPRYETTFQLLHKLRVGMVRPDQDRIGIEGEHVEADETWMGGRTRGKGRGVHDKVLAAAAVEVKQRKPGSPLNKRRNGRYAGRVRLAVTLDRSAASWCGAVNGGGSTGHVYLLRMTGVVIANLRSADSSILPKPTAATRRLP